MRKKREDEDDSIVTVKHDDLLETMRPREHPSEMAQMTSSTPGTSDYLDEEITSIISPSTQSTDEKDIDLQMTTSSSKEEDEENYDYEKFKSEYYEQLDNLMNRNMTYNFTENGEVEETPKEALKKIIEFKVPKNCTPEESMQIGAKAFECLIFDYQNAKNNTDMKNILRKSWLIIRVWLFIYLCIAVPAWFQKGWCCCCFRCKLCFPLEKIESIKKYYVSNSPGICQEVYGNDEVNYKPTAFELEAYEELESAIRNL